MKQLGPGSPVFFVAFPKHVRRMIIIQSCIFLFVLYFLYRFGFFTYIMMAAFGTEKNHGNILSHFPDAKNDATDITWMHAVNDKKSLSRAIKSKCHIIEGDVMYVMDENTGKKSLIMAHPPATSSDLSFNVWLQTIVETEKGIKIDFKVDSAVPVAMEALHSIKSRLRGPVIINSDILTGPNSRKIFPKVKATPFIDSWKTHAPDTLLSVGWMTKDGPEGYSWSDVVTMYSTLLEAGVIKKNDGALKITPRITFPVRASLCHSGSIERLHWLIDVVPFSSLTIWGHNEDGYQSVTDLLILRHRLQPSQFFIDLESAYPTVYLKEFHNLKKKLNQNQFLTKFADQLTEPSPIAETWDVLHNAANLVIVGTVSLVVRGSTLMMSSAHDFKSTPLQTTRLKMIVHPWGDETSCKVQIGMREIDIKDEHLNGVVSTLDFRSGRLTIQNFGAVDGKIAEERFEDTQLGRNTAFSLDVNDDGSRIVLVANLLDSYSTREVVVRSSRRLVLATTLNNQKMTKVVVVTKCETVSTYIAIHDISLTSSPAINEH